MTFSNQHMTHDSLKMQMTANFNPQFVGDNFCTGWGLNDSTPQILQPQADKLHNCCEFSDYLGIGYRTSSFEYALLQVPVYCLFLPDFTNSL